MYSILLLSTYSANLIYLPPRVSKQLVLCISFLTNNAVFTPLYNFCPLPPLLLLYDSPYHAFTYLPLFYLPI